MTDIERHDMVMTRLDEIHELAKATNGRVRSLELWRARLEGARVVFGGIHSWVVAVVASGVGAAIASVVHF